MTGYKNKFLKLLFTHPGTEPYRGQEMVKEFVAGFLRSNANETESFFVKNTH